MRNLITKFGRTWLTALITLFSIILSILITILIIKMSGKDVDSTSILISILAPMIIAPTVSWHMVTLIKKIQHLEEEQRNLATYDMLTGIMTRRAFIENCNTLMKLVERNKALMSLAYIDIDNFKEINDTHGHAGGDEVLKSFASGFHKHLRESDLVGRIGGEEFAVALPDTDLKNAFTVLEKIIFSARNTEINFSGHTINFTVSIGISQYGLNNQVGFEQLARQSDEALYKAKISGKNCIVKYKATNAH